MAASGLSCSAASWLQCSSFSLVVVCGFSLCSCGTQAPGCMGSVVCGVQALLLRHASSAVLVHGLNCPAACGILVPRPGIESTSPELEGRFFTAGPLGKSLFLLLMEYCSYFTDVIASLLSPGILLFSFLKKIN